MFSFFFPVLTRGVKEASHVEFKLMHIHVKLYQRCRNNLTSRNHNSNNNKDEKKKNTALLSEKMKKMIVRKRQFSSGIEYIHRRQKYHPLKRQNLYSPILLGRECLLTRGDEEKDIVREGGRVRSIVSCKSSLFFCLSFSHLVVTSFFFLLFVLTGAEDSTHHSTLTWKNT